MPPPRDKDRDRSKDERESRENREGARGATDPAPVRKQPGEGKEDERVDREAAETFPASDPPANY